MASRTWVILSLVFISSAVVAHKNHHMQKVDESPTATLEKISDIYNKTVKPIFQKACFDCHSSSTKFPWYSSIPIIKGFIAKDIVEAKEHLDMDPGFPFKSHARPAEDLEAIKESLDGGSMPPLRYRLLHPSSKLTGEEIGVVKVWVDESLKELEKPK